MASARSAFPVASCLRRIDQCRADAGGESLGTFLQAEGLAEHPVEQPLLIQVSLDTAEDATWEREVRSLEAAAEEYPDARPLLITLDPTPPSRPLPAPLEWRSATEWLLEWVRPGSFGAG